MKPLFLALLFTLGSLPAFGQSNPPDCQFTATFTATSTGLAFNNKTSAGATPCVKWRVAYFADGLSSLSIQLEGANDTNGIAGTWSAIAAGNVYEGSNPLTNAAQGTAAMTAYYPWIRLNVTTFTPVGGAPHEIVARVYGYKGTTASAGTLNPPTGAAGGDLSGTYPNPTVAKVNGGSVPASAHVLGSNGSSQPVASTATDISAIVYAAGGGIAQAQTVALSPAVTALTNGLTVCWLPTAANTATAPTLAVNLTAAKPITKLGATALVANDLTTTAVACAIYDGTEFQLQNPQTASSGGPAYYQTVDDAATPLPQEPALNFAGAGVSCADNPGATRTDCTISGAAGTPGATVFSSTSTAGPNDSAAETSVIGTVTGSQTIAANTFTNGALLQAHAQGFFSLPAVSDSLTVKMKCGSTVIGSAVLTPGAGALTNGSWRFWLDIASRGSGAGAFITNGLVELTGAALTDTTSQVLNTTTVAYDFTTACVFDVTAQWGAAQVGETFQGTNVAAWFPGGTGGGGGGTTVSAGVFASLPGCSTTAFHYLFTNTEYTDAFCDGASNLTYRYGGYAITPPITTGWSWVNQGGATIDTANYGMWVLTAPKTGSGSARIWTKALPAAPYTITMLFQAQCPGYAYQRCGFILSDGTKFAFYLFIGNVGVGVVFREEIWNNPTSPTGTIPFTYNNFGLAGVTTPIWLQIADTGSAGGNLRNFAYSTDGITWTLAFSESNTANLTPTNFGIAASEETNAVTATIKLLSISGI